jgi:hypothetical protein
MTSGAKSEGGFGKQDFVYMSTVTPENLCTCLRPFLADFVAKRFSASEQPVGLSRKS